MQNLKQREIHTASEQLDRILAFVGRAWRHGWKAALIVALGGAASVAVALKAPRRYRSEAVVLYREPIDQTYVAGADARRLSASDLGRRLRDLLLGRPRLKKLIDEFKLLQQIVDDRSYIEAEDKLRMLIDFRFGGGDTFHIAYTGTSPELTQKVTARLAKVLIEDEVRMRSEQARATVRFLEGERRRTEGELKEKEQHLAEFLAKHPEFAADESPTASGAALRAQERKRRGEATATATGGVSPLAVMRRQLKRIKTQLDRAKGRKPMLVHDPKLEAVKREAEREVRSAVGRLREARARYTDAHPDVTAARSRAKLARLRLERVKLRERAAAKYVTLGGDAVAALEKRRDELTGQIAAFRRRRSGSSKGAKNDKKRDGSGGGAATKIVDMETLWTRLNREVREARERYLRIESRVFRASLGLTVQRQSHLRIIDPAYVPKRPSGGGRSKMVLLGAAVSIFLGLALLFALALFDERIYDRKDAERLRLAEVLVVVPRRRPRLIQRVLRFFWRRGRRHR
ncbi:MAG: hypothetical protein KAI47_08905 [Deltaproteobacteria bacterium]|nr:hypothetical protein [Deltaproteobacteria bacterium]